MFSGSARDDPNWGSAIIMSAWQHYQAYGDLGTLRAYFPAMRSYFDYLTSKASGSLLDYGYGDWVSTDSSTPVGIAATYAYYRDAVRSTRSRVSSARTPPATRPRPGRPPRRSTRSTSTPAPTARAAKRPR